MAAMGGVALFIVMLAWGLACIIPAEALIGCGIYELLIISGKGGKEKYIHVKLAISQKMYYYE